MKLRILIADDHEVVRRGLCTLLQMQEGWEICGEAKDGREAVEMAKQLKPDVVILDIGMPNLNGLAATRQLAQQRAEQKIIVLTITDSDQVIREALNAGARGFVLKSDAARDLVSAVEALQRGRMFFTPRVNDMVLAGFLDKGYNGTSDELPHVAEADAAGARSDSASGGGEKLEGSGLSVKPEHQNRGDAPQQHHAQTRLSLHPRSGRVRGQKRHHPGATAGD